MASAAQKAAKERWLKANPTYHREWYQKHKDEQKAYRARNRERRAEVHRQWKRRNPERIRRLLRNRDLRRAYGISVDKFEEMLKAQSGNCALCFEPLLQDKNLDHDHKTGEIRGILHGRCNRLLAFAQDSISKLNAAIKYLDKHRSLRDGH